MRADSPWLTVVAEKEPTEGEYQARTRVMGVVGSRVFLTVHTASSSCGAHPDWSTEFVVFDVETMAPVNLEEETNVQRWAQHHIPERTCEEGCNCEPFTTLVLYPRFTAAGELRATGVYLWREESYVCTSGEWGAYFSSVPVPAAAPAAWVRAYQPLLADARIAMEGQRGRLLGATSVSDELRAAFVRRRDVRDCSLWRRGSEVAWSEADENCQLSDRNRPDLNIVVPGEDVVRPTLALERAMRPLLPLAAPADPKPRSEHALGFRGGEVTHVRGSFIRRQ